MIQDRVAPYGSWRSPITSELIVSATVTLDFLKLDCDDIYWVEGRAKEGGRSVVVRYATDGRISDITPSAFNSRTKVHEYGGGDYAVDNGMVVFANFVDQRLYLKVGEGEPRPITAEGPMRYADIVFDRPRRRLVCVREEHSAGEVRQPVNSIVGIDLDGYKPADVLVSGNDFYSNPILSADGSRLAWLTWNHPNMPWDGSELRVGDIMADGSIARDTPIAGGPDESIFQPEWSPDGSLFFVSDRTGWWNLYRYRDGGVSPMAPMEAEFGRPQWVFGMSTYAIVSPDRLVCAYCQSGRWHLGLLEVERGRLQPLDLPYTDFKQVRVTGRHIVLVAGAPNLPWSVLRIDLAGQRTETLRRASDLAIDSGYISAPQAIEFPTTRGLVAHGFFYPPRNRDFRSQEGERPPLLVKSHGGPTSAATTTLNLNIQFWTSRGIAVLDVDYGGSTGYGRAYRQRLDGLWGIVDVEDCVNGARYLVERGEVDCNRLAISGGSAGGYTTLAALTFHDVFKAGASHYGIGDLEALARDTHKFESRYLDRLVGPYPACRDLYLQRSPINFTDRLSCPVILFQGLDDKVVPPNQAKLMAGALRAKGLPVAYVVFEGEGHGFRRAENIKRALDGELYFYGRVFGFQPAEPIEPVQIENL